MTFTTNFEIEDLGIQELDVYDIEVEDCHNFFANDILVHNSAYHVLPSQMVENIKGISEINEKIDAIDSYIENEIQPIINESSKELGDIFNAMDPSKISAKREVIAEKAIFIAKKRYVMKVWDSEGVRFDEPHLKMMGIDLVRSSTPKFSKKYLKDSIDILLNGSESDVLEYIAKVKEAYQSAPLGDIGKVSSISKLSYDLARDKSIPINARAVIVSNDYIRKNCAGRFNELQSGEKCKMLYLRTPNPLGANIFAYDNEDFARIFASYIDYDTNFDKFFLKPLEIMTTPLKFNVYKQTENLDIW